MVWFLMSLGASGHEAADVAQTAFTEAFPVWPTIRCPRAWLRQVASRIYYRQLNRAETPVESLPDGQGPLSAAVATELRDEARTVLAALASLPPRQREVMAWHIDGFGSAEIAATLHIDPAAVRQNLIKARRPQEKAWDLRGSAMSWPTGDDLTWHDDDELDAFLMAAKVGGLKALNDVLDVAAKIAAISRPPPSAAEKAD